MEVNLFFFLYKHLLKKEMSMLRIIIENFFFSCKKFLKNGLTENGKFFKFFFPFLKINFKCSYFNKLEYRKTKNLKRFSKDLFKIKFQKFLGFFIHLIPIQLIIETDLLFLLILPTLNTGFLPGENIKYKAVAVFLKIAKEIKLYLNSRIKRLYFLAFVYKKVFKKLLKKIWDHSANDICFSIGIFDKKKKSFFLKNLYENKLNILFKNLETKETILSIKKFTKINNNLKKDTKFYPPFLFFLQMIKFGFLKNRKNFFREIIFYKKFPFFTILFIKNLVIFVKKKSNRLILDQIFFCENLKIYKCIKRNCYNILNQNIFSFLNLNFIEIKKKINCLGLKKKLFENYINFIHIIGIFELKKNSIKKIKKCHLNIENFHKLKRKNFLKDCIRVFQDLIFCPFNYQIIFSEFKFICKPKCFFCPTIFFFFLKAPKKNKKIKKVVQLEKENMEKIYKLKSDRYFNILTLVKSKKKFFFSKHFFLVFLVNFSKRSIKRSIVILFTFFNILKSFFIRELIFKKKKLFLYNFLMRKIFRKTRTILFFCLFLSNLIAKTQKINVKLFFLLNVIKTIYQIKYFFQSENYKKLFDLNLVYRTLKPFFLHYRTFVGKGLFQAKKEKIFLYNNEGFFFEIFLILNFFFLYGIKESKNSIGKILDLFNLHRKNYNLNTGNKKIVEPFSSAKQRKVVLLFLQNQINGNFSKIIETENYNHLY